MLQATRRHAGEMTPDDLIRAAPADQIRRHDRLPVPGQKRVPSAEQHRERDGEQPDQDSEVLGPDDVVERDGEGVQFAHREPGHRTSSTTTARSPPKSWAGASRVETSIDSSDSGVVSRMSGRSTASRRRRAVVVSPCQRPTRRPSQPA